MPPDNFVKVFDVLDSGFKDWVFPAFGLIPVTIGTIIFFFPYIIRAIGLPYFNFRSKIHTFRRYFILGFALFWTCITFYGTYPSYHRHQLLAENNSCKVVEGYVEHFIPEPYAGHSFESFDVSGVHFAYADAVVTDAFNNSSSHGGPINKDSYVRICYDPYGNAILRLEVRGFTGPIKDYAKIGMFSEGTGWHTVHTINKDNKGIILPWYNQIFFVLFILDVIARLNLFRPYLDTFFRLKVTPVSDCPIPGNLEEKKKIKLSNNILYWEKERRAIWLRPRGFNFLRVPPMAAKLNTDESGKSIVSQEIRFSSGVPVIIVLFMFTAYKFSSMVMPSQAMAGAFVGFFSLICIISGYVQFKFYRARMEKLVLDALAELKAM